MLSKVPHKNTVGAQTFRCSTAVGFHTLRWWSHSAVRTVTAGTVRKASHDFGTRQHRAAWDGQILFNGARAYPTCSIIVTSTPVQLAKQVHRKGYGDVWCGQVQLCWIWIVPVSSMAFSVLTWRCRPWNRCLSPGATNCSRRRHRNYSTTEDERFLSIASKGAGTADVTFCSAATTTDLDSDRKLNLCKTPLRSFSS